MNPHGTSSRPNTRQTSSQAKTHGGQPAENPSSPKSTPSNADLQKDIANFSSRVLEKLDNISAEIQSMNRRLGEVEALAQHNSSQIESIKKDIPSVRSALEDEINNLKEKLTQMEIHNRKSNLLFYGVQEQQGENVYDVLTKVFIDLGVAEDKARNIKLINAHRLPRRNPQATSSPSPIIAKFCFMTDRDLVLSSFEMKQRSKTRDPYQAQAAPLTASAVSSQEFNRLTVRTDLPPNLKAHRGHLAQVAYKLRKEKNLSTRIKLQGVKVILEWKEKGTTAWKLHE